MTTAWMVGATFAATVSTVSTMSTIAPAGPAAQGRSARGGATALLDEGCRRDDRGDGGGGPGVGRNRISATITGVAVGSSPPASQ
ncbi:MAG: hypothetical protein AB7P03_14990 [Kofleriaceae bacterium]